MGNKEDRNSVFALLNGCSVGCHEQQFTLRCVVYGGNGSTKKTIITQRVQNHSSIFVLFCFKFLILIEPDPDVG
jgi:hypothetical protein